ncbi:MAG: hypothetical protein QOC89_2797, partial [Paraburkholderia sp.]|nr:hypothetical protein [Paraburkholderia sp.]
MLQKSGKTQPGDLVTAEARTLFNPYTVLRTIIARISLIARSGSSPSGHTSTQFMMVRQRYSL